MLNDREEFYIHFIYHTYIFT